MIFKHKDPIGVVGFDVAGDEGSYPLQSSEDSMTAGTMRAVELGVPVTVHAGEWPEKHRTVENIRFKLNLKRHFSNNFHICVSRFKLTLSFSTKDIWFNGSMIVSLLTFL
jgi:hypothetical protein